MKRIPCIQLQTRWPVSFYFFQSFYVCFSNYQLINQPSHLLTNRWVIKSRSLGNSNHFSFQLSHVDGVISGSKLKFLRSSQGSFNFSMKIFYHFHRFQELVSIVLHSSPSLERKQGVHQGWNFHNIVLAPFAKYIIWCTICRLRKLNHETVLRSHS